MSGKTGESKTNPSATAPIALTPEQTAEMWAWYQAQSGRANASALTAATAAEQSAAEKRVKLRARDLGKVSRRAESEDRRALLWDEFGPE